MMKWYEQNVAMRELKANNYLMLLFIIPFLVIVPLFALFEIFFLYPLYYVSALMTSLICHFGNDWEEEKEK